MNHSKTLQRRRQKQTARKQARRADKRARRAYHAAKNPQPKA